MTLTRNRRRNQLPTLSKSSSIRVVLTVAATVAVAGAFWWFRARAGEEPNRRPGTDPKPPVSQDKVGEPGVSNPPDTILLDAEQQQAIGLQTIAVTSGSSQQVVTAPGRVAPNETQYAYITPRAAGVVRSVTAHLGQEVKAGDLLATIESPVVGDARLELYSRLQIYDLAKAQADWQETVYRNTIDLVERLHKNESPQVIHEAFTRKPVGENRERLMTAYAKYRLAQATIERNRDLFAQKLITPKQFQQVEADYEVAEATHESLMDQMGFETKLANTRAQQARKQAETSVRAAQERLRILGVKPDGTEPEVQGGRVIGVKPDGTLPASEAGAAPLAEQPETVLPMARQKEKLAVKPVGSPADSSKGTSDAAVSTYSIWAPFDGTILDREMIVPGVAVDTTHRIFTLANLSSVYVEVNIHEDEFGSLARSKGGKVRFTSPAYPGKAFDGEVIYTGDLVEDTSRTVKLIARAVNPDRMLKPGMFVGVEVLGASPAQYPQIPVSAVVARGDHSLVFVRKGPETFVEREVTVENQEGQKVSIRSGLQPGEQVVTEGAFKIKQMAARLATTEP